jgi:hypothetical protein
MIKKTLNKIRPTLVDLVRATGYMIIIAWAILFLFYPPEAFVSSIDIVIRVFWMGVTIVGAGLAALGALTRIDLKLEFPGLLFALIGPLFYFASQAFYVTFPDPGVDQTGRVALIAYAILPGVLLLPRALELYKTGKGLQKTSVETEALRLQLAQTNSLLVVGQGTEEHHASKTEEA